MAAFLFPDKKKNPLKRVSECIRDSVFFKHPSPTHDRLLILTSILAHGSSLECLLIQSWTMAYILRLRLQ